MHVVSTGSSSLFWRGNRPQRGLVRRFAWAALPLLLLSGCFTDKGHQGQKLYALHCASCHGEQGEGLGQLVPPLAASDYLTRHAAELPCLIRHGLRGPITVNGVGYNQWMIGVLDTTTHRKLSPAQLTNLLNFVESHWGNHPGPGGPRTIAGTETQLRTCAER